MDVRAAEVHAVAVSTHDMAAAGNLSGDDHLLFGVAESAARFLQLDIAVMRLAFLGAAVAAPPLVLAYPLAYLGLRGRHIRPWGQLAGADSLIDLIPIDFALQFCFTETRGQLICSH